MKRAGKDTSRDPRNRTGGMLREIAAIRVELLPWSI